MAMINAKVFEGRLSMYQQTTAHLQSCFALRPGDVVLARLFPIISLQRMLVSLVEGGLNPWQPGLLNKPHYLEAGASRRGVNNYLSEVETWTGRRCFKTHNFPKMLPFAWPPEPVCAENVFGKVPPKIVVFVADPRYALALMKEVFSTKSFVNPMPMPCDMTDFIEAIVDQKLQVFGEYFDYALAWADEALEHPANVRLFSAERFASHNPRDVCQAVVELAEFLEVPKASEVALHLVSLLSQSPPDVHAVFQGDSLIPLDVMHGGPMIELVGPRLQAFQDALFQASNPVQCTFRRMLTSWFDAPSLCLATLGESAAKGVASLLPITCSRPWKGKAVHREGTCRKCVFHLRGICRNSAEMCAYCHSDGHAPTKRASRKKRAQRKVRVYTPSPDGLSS